MAARGTAGGCPYNFIYIMIPSMMFFPRFFIFQIRQIIEGVYIHCPLTIQAGYLKEGCVMQLIYDSDIQFVTSCFIQNSAGSSLSIYSILIYINGVVAEWLGRGLQNLVHRFKSGPRLQIFQKVGNFSLNVLSGIMYWIAFF